MSRSPNERMAFTTPNMALKIWNSLSDPYDHEQLAANFVKIDRHDHGALGGQQISTAGIADGSITAAKLATGALTGTQVAPGGIFEPNMADNSVSTRTIVAANVTNAKMATNSIATANVIDRAITPAKLFFVEEVDVTAVALQDITILATDKLCIIDFDLETSALCEFRMFPNNITTASYTYVRDGSYVLSTPSFVAVAAAGVSTADVNGIRLAVTPQVAAAGGQQMTGQATFGSRIPTAAVRTCISQSVVGSITASNNHLAELQNVASRFASLASLTSLRFTVSAGTMTGRIRVQHF